MPPLASTLITLPSSSIRAQELNHGHGGCCKNRPVFQHMPETGIHAKPAFGLDLNFAHVGAKLLMYPFPCEGGVAIPCFTLISPLLHPYLTFISPLFHLHFTLILLFFLISPVFHAWFTIITPPSLLQANNAKHVFFGDPLLKCQHDILNLA